MPRYFLDAILSRPEGEEQIANISFLIPVMPLDEQEALIDEIRAELDPPAGRQRRGRRPAGARRRRQRRALRLPLLADRGQPARRRPRPARGLPHAARALVPLIPIAMATGWSALVIEAMRIPLNPMSATLGALVIAVATEFSVILAARYHEERARGPEHRRGAARTYTRTGTAVLASGITSIAGFGVLIASGITMLRDFGLVTIVDLSVALAGVMLVLPAALVWAEGGFRPFPAYGPAAAPAQPPRAADARAGRAEARWRPRPDDRAGLVAGAGRRTSGRSGRRPSRRQERQPPREPRPRAAATAARAGVARPAEGRLPLLALRRPRLRRARDRRGAQRRAHRGGRDARRRPRCQPRACRWPSSRCPTALGAATATRTSPRTTARAPATPARRTSSATPACEIEQPGAIRICDLFDKPLAISFWFTRGGDCTPTQDAFDRVAGAARARPTSSR